MLHTQTWTGAEIYSLSAAIKQNYGGHAFKDNIEVWIFVNREQKSLFQGTINASVLEDNMCESGGITIQLNLYCFLLGL